MTYASASGTMRAMRIVVIGSGRIGGTLTRRLARLGHDVVVAGARGPEALEDLVRETGAKATTTSDLPADADVVMSAWTAEQVGRPVIKALNTITARSRQEHGRSPGAADRIAAPVAGDDEEAKQRVIELVDALGFEAFDAGNLADSWRQQPGTPVYGADLPLDAARAAIAAARPEQSTVWRDAVRATTR